MNDVVSKSYRYLVFLIALALLGPPAVPSATGAIEILPNNTKLPVDAMRWVPPPVLQAMRPNLVGVEHQAFVPSGRVDSSAPLVPVETLSVAQTRTGARGARWPIVPCDAMGIDAGDRVSRLRAQGRSAAHL